MKSRRNTIAVFNRSAQDYNDKYRDQSKYAHVLTFFIKHFPVHAENILDVACGPANVSAYLKSHRPSLIVTGIDLAPAMLSLARKNITDGNFYKKDIRDILSLNATFGGIVCSFGLPYLSRSDAMRFIADSAQLLIQTGLLYISTMEGNYEDSKWIKSTKESGEGIYTFLHESPYLVEAIESNGMEVIKTERVLYLHHNEVVCDLILIARKK